MVANKNVICISHTFFRATCPAHLYVLYLITLTVGGDEFMFRDFYFSFIELLCWTSYIGAVKFNITLRFRTSICFGC
jgi:hypothetical protein